jgi:hypothetical protein
MLSRVHADDAVECWGGAFQTDANMTDGTVGGALVDVRGRFLGLGTLWLTVQQGRNPGIGYGVPGTKLLAAPPSRTGASFLLNSAVMKVEPQDPTARSSKVVACGPASASSRATSSSASAASRSRTRGSCDSACGSAGPAIASSSRTNAAANARRSRSSWADARPRPRRRSRPRPPRRRSRRPRRRPRRRPWRMLPPRWTARPRPRCPTRPRRWTARPRPRCPTRPRDGRRGPARDGRRGPPAMALTGRAGGWGPMAA